MYSQATIVDTLIVHTLDYMKKYDVSVDEAISDYDMYIPEETWHSVRWYFNPENTEGHHAV